VELLIDWLGWYGMVAVLAGFVGISSGKLTAGWLFQILNFTGALGLCANTAYNGAWPSASLNLIWALFALAALGQLARRGANEPPNRRAIRECADYLNRAYRTASEDTTLDTLYQGFKTRNMV
jgi:hypothetical protein